MDESKCQDLWLENIGQIIFTEDNEFFWIIPQLFLSRINRCVISPRFRFDNEDWCVGMIPHKDHRANCIYGSDALWINIFLWNKSQNALKQRYYVQLDIETFTGQTMCFEHENEVLTDDYGYPYLRRHDGETDAYGFDGSVFLSSNRHIKSITLSKRVKIRCLIKRKDDDNLEDLCMCPVTEGENENQTASVEEKIEKRENEPELKGADRLVQNLNSLLQNEWGSDVILKNADHEFRAHTVLLIARSPVFASMFQHDMTEKKTGCVDISDCFTQGFKVFLRFLYTGNADAMSTANVFDLYYIADKYQVDDLKADCIEFLKNTLSVGTFCDVIALSLRHCESDLQNAATRFFSSNMKAIIKTVSWQKYITENPIHANELIIKAVNA